MSCKDELDSDCRELARKLAELSEFDRLERLQSLLQWIQLSLPEPEPDSQRYD